MCVIPSINSLLTVTLLVAAWTGPQGRTSTYNYPRSKRPWLAPLTPRDHSSGLHVVAPFNDIIGRDLTPDQGRLRLFSRLPVFAGKRGLFAAQLVAGGDRKQYLLDQATFREMTNNLTTLLNITRSLQIHVLPRELGPMHPPLMTDQGVMVVASGVKRVILLRLLTGVALSHPDLPQDHSLLSTIIRYGASSRYLAHYITPGIKLPQSPLVGLTHVNMRQRLPHLLAFVLHYASEPERSFEDGWLSNDDLEILGWLATTPYTRWDQLGSARIKAELVPCGPKRAPALPGASKSQVAWRDMAWSALHMKAEQQLAGQSLDATIGPFGAEFSLGFVESRGRKLDGRSMLVITHRNGVSLVRYQRFDPNKGEYLRTFMQVSPAVVDVLLRRLEELNLASINSDTRKARSDAVMYSFHLEGDEARLGFDFYGPTGPSSRHGQVQSILSDFLMMLGVR